jgi:F-type H+-transporting ATPase subunit epsilon
MSTLPLRIVSPERVTWEGAVESVTVPAVNGGLGILPGHAPLLAQLAEGVVHVKGGDAGGEKVLAVSGGFVEVMNGRVSLFAETAELAEEIDAERARQAVEQAQRALKASPTEVLDETVVAAMRRAMVRLHVAELARLRNLSGKAPHPHE